MRAYLYLLRQHWSSGIVCSRILNTAKFCPLIGLHLCITNHKSHQINPTPSSLMRLKAFRFHCVECWLELLTKGFYQTPYSSTTDKQQHNATELLANIFFN